MRQIGAAFVMLGLGACHAKSASVPDQVDGWARRVLAMPVEQVCTPGTPLPDAYACQVRTELLPAPVRDLGATNVTLENLHSPERYLDLDWGEPHDSHGVLIGAEDWTPDPQLYKRKLRPGVYTYETE